MRGSVGGHCHRSCRDRNGRVVCVCNGGCCSSCGLLGGVRGAAKGSWGPGWWWQQRPLSSSCSSAAAVAIAARAVAIAAIVSVAAVARAVVIAAVAIAAGAIAARHPLLLLMAGLISA
jgi:hypothetical protein